jgi:hypothetical protein
MQVRVALRAPRAAFCGGLANDHGCPEHGPAARE